jgi:hypothetical protein
VERHEPSTAAVTDQVGKLTPRERELPSMLTVGLTNGAVPTAPALEHRVPGTYPAAGGTNRTDAVLDLKEQGDLPEPGGSKRQPTGSG